MTAVELVRAEIERRIALCEAATPGPWQSLGGYGGVTAPACNICGTQRHICVMHDGRRTVLAPDSAPTDAAFIAAHSPSFMLGVYRQHLDVLDRHTCWASENKWCSVCYSEEDEKYLRWPCVSLTSVLALYRDVQEGAENE